MSLCYYILINLLLIWNFYLIKMVVMVSYLLNVFFMLVRLMLVKGEIDGGGELVKNCC